METIGYRIKVHESLITPILLAGVPRRFAILNGVVCGALVLGLHAIYVLPIFVILHIIALFLVKKDPCFFEVLIRHLRKNKYYGI